MCSGDLSAREVDRDQGGTSVAAPTGWLMTPVGALCVQTGVIRSNHQVRAAHRGPAPVGHHAVRRDLRHLGGATRVGTSASRSGTHARLYQQLRGHLATLKLHNAAVALTAVPLGIGVVRGWRAPAQRALATDGEYRPDPRCR